MTENKKKRRVMIIGFDGATLELINPWVEQGVLPNFQRMMAEGAYGELESAMPPVTPAAWSCLATGMNQGKHGLFDFFHRRSDSYETYLVDANHRHGPTIWHLLSEAKQQVTVFNVPATYPPDDVNGMMVSGLLTPAQATDASKPETLLNELKEEVPSFSFYPPGIFSKGQEMQFIQDVLSWDKMTLMATQFLMEKDSWDFFFTVFIGVDIMSHFMWREMATNGECVQSSDAATKEALANAIQSVYKQADDILGQMLDAADEDTYIMLVSDHGFGPLDNYIHLNAWLVQKGYLQFKRTPFITAKYLAYRLGITPLRILELMRSLRLGGQVQKTASTHNDRLKDLVKRFFLSVNDIDWSRTTAYSVGYGGPVFINLKGREPQGIVAPGAEYEALISKLTADLKSIKDPQTGSPLIGEVVRTNELYHGPYAEGAADLLALPHDWRNQGYGVHDFASNRWLEPSPDRSGTHRMNGIFFLKGSGVESGKVIENAGLIDIMPTVLGLMGVPIPRHIDGKVLADAFHEEFLTELDITYRDGDELAYEEQDKIDMDEGDEQLIVDRLNALGYLG